MTSTITQTGFVEVGTSKLYFEREGNREGRSVLFIHGLGGTTNAYQSLLPALQDLDLIRFDWSGHGRSTVPVTTSLNSYVEDCEAIIKHLALQDVAVVAHSMGGLVALHLAAKRSDIIKQMILFGPVNVPPELGRLRTRERAETVRKGGMVAVADAIVLNALAADTLRSKPVVAAFAREMLCRQDSEGYALACDALAASEAPDWEAITAKVIVVLGEEDKVSTSQVGQGIASSLRQAAKVDVITWTTVGHWHMLEAPEKATSIIKQAAS